MEENGRNVNRLYKTYSNKIMNMCWNATVPEQVFTRWIIKFFLLFYFIDKVKKTRECGQGRISHGDSRSCWSIFSLTDIFVRDTVFTKQGPMDWKWQAQDSFSLFIMSLPKQNVQLFSISDTMKNFLGSRSQWLVEGQVSS